MTKTVVLAIPSLVLTLCALTAPAIEQMPPEFDAKIFRVSPSDKDPFAKASTCVREWKRLNGGRLPRGGVIVEFAEGIYPLASTWRLGADDSGTPDCPVRYRAAAPGKVVFSGSRTLAWRRLGEECNLPPSAALIPAAVRGNIMTCRLPEGESAPGFFAASRYMQDEQLDRKDYEYALALYQANRRLENARWPNGAFAHVSKLTGEVRKSWILRDSRSRPFGAEGLGGEKPDLADWVKEPDLYLHGNWRHEYIDTTAKPESIDPEKGLITPEKRDAQFGIRLGGEFIAINAVSELDMPGEWALDLKARRLYVWPHEDAELPRLGRTKTLLECSSVTDVTFEGFVFEDVRGHAVVFADCRDVTLETSIVRHTTGWGVRVERGRGCRVEGCDLYDLGEGGVWLEGGAVDTLTPSRHVCENCRIHDYAILAWNYNPGVRLFGCGNTALNNLIYNAPQQACFFYGAENRFAFNIVHDVCRHTDDAGGIYAYHTHNAWSYRGNRIEHNVFHRIAPRKPRYCQLNAIYLDAFTSGSIVRGNIINDASLGVFSSGGQDNLIEKNITVHGRNGSVRRWNLGLMGGKRRNRHIIHGKTNNSDRVSYVMKPLYDKGDLYTMAFWKNRFPNMMRAIDFADPANGHSSHFCTIRNNVAADSHDVIIIDPQVTEETTVVDGNVVVPGDPGFVDYEGMNWEVKVGSPAWKALGGGTRFGEMGLYASSKRITPPVKWGPGVTRPQPFNRNAGRGKWVDWNPAAGEIAEFLRKAEADGASKVCVSGVVAGPYAPATDICEALSVMDAFSWDISDDTRPFKEVKNGIVDLALMYRKLVRVYVRDLDAERLAELKEGLARAPQNPEVVCAQR